MNIIIPIGAKRFYDNTKINCMPAQGHIRYGDQREDLQPGTCIGSLDWGRGVWEYQSFWNWASASGFLPDGRTIGLNLGQGFGDLSKATENAVGRRASIADYRWVGLDESLSHLEAAKWMRQHVAPERVSMRVDSLVGLVEAVAAGFGAGWLLCPLADGRRDLVRLQEPMAAMDTQIWVLTHRDLRRTARIHALTGFLYERLSVDPRLSHG